MSAPVEKPDAVSLLLAADELAGLAAERRTEALRWGREGLPADDVAEAIASAERYWRVALWLRDIA